MVKIKICGITSSDDIEIINNVLPEYAGFVMFFPKSKRNITPQRASLLLNLLDSRIKSVAVTVNPTPAQISTAKSCGFDYVQIHGEASDDVIINSPLPILKAFNVSDICDFERYADLPNVRGFVFDANSPGSGKTFDWSILKNIPRNDKLFILAGGLNEQNVCKAIDMARPDAVDVSSGVESDTPPLKDAQKVENFVHVVRLHHCS